MKLTLSGKEFTLRADFRAFAAAKREAGIELGNLSDDPVEAGTLVYYMAMSGHKFAGIPFDYELDDFLGLIQMGEVETMTLALVELLGGGTEKKSEG